MSGATLQSAQQEKSVSQTAKAFAAQSPTSGLAPLTIRRRAPGPQDVQIDILYCGVCHSDLHQVRNEWQKAMPTTYPCVPGHEIVGRVVKTGSAVTKFKAGDLAAVGCMVDSCRTAPHAAPVKSSTATAFPRSPTTAKTNTCGGVTYGGYSESVVVDEAFVLRVSGEIGSRRDGAAAVRRHHDILAAAPLEGRQGPEGRHRRTRRAGSHGREVRQRVRRGSRALHDFAGQDRGRAAARRARSGGVKERRGDEEA